MIRNKKALIFLFLLTIAVLIIYAFFCPDDKFEIKNAAGLIAVSAVSMIMLAFVNPQNTYIKTAIAIFLTVITPFFCCQVYFVRYIDKKCAELLDRNTYPDNSHAVCIYFYKKNGGSGRLLRNFQCAFRSGERACTLFSQIGHYPDRYL